MMARYYASIDHSDWTPPGNYGGTTFGWTKNTYGNGSSDYTAHRTAALAAQATLSAEVMEDIMPGNKGLGGAQRCMGFEGPTHWETSDGARIAEVMQHVPTHSIAVAAANAWLSGRTPGRDSTLVNPATTEGYIPQSDGVDSVSFTYTNYTDACAAVDAIVEAAGVMATLSADPTMRQRGLSSLQFSEDSWHIYWDAEPPISTMVAPTIVHAGGSSAGDVVEVAWSPVTNNYYNVDVWTYQTESPVGWKQIAENVALGAGTTGHIVETLIQGDARLFICRASDSQIQFMTPTAEELPPAFDITVYLGNHDAGTPGSGDHSYDILATVTGDHTGHKFNFYGSFNGGTFTLLAADQVGHTYASWVNSGWYDTEAGDMTTWQGRIIMKTDAGVEVARADTALESHLASNDPY